MFCGTFLFPIYGSSFCPYKLGSGIAFLIALGMRDARFKNNLFLGHVNETEMPQRVRNHAQVITVRNLGCRSVRFMLNFASEGFRHKQMLEVFLINSAGRGMKKTWNHGDQALGAAGNTL